MGDGEEDACELLSSKNECLCFMLTNIWKWLVCETHGLSPQGWGTDLVVLNRYVC